MNSASIRHRVENTKIRIFYPLKLGTELGTKNKLSR